jgi:hypothetical protein
MFNRQQNREEKALKEEQMQAEGLLSERYPEVLTIIIDMTYNRKPIHPTLMKRTMYYYPNNYAYFHWGCMAKSCTDGGYDLSRIIANMVKEHKETGTGEMDCDNSAREHASISYEISVTYATDH